MEASAVSKSRPSHRLSLPTDFPHSLHQSHSYANCSPSTNRVSQPNSVTNNQPSYTHSRLDSLFDPLAELITSQVEDLNLEIESSSDITPPSPAPSGQVHQMQSCRNSSQASVSERHLAHFSSSSLSASLPSILSDVMGDLDVENEDIMCVDDLWLLQCDDISWQEKCYTLEVSMQKFRDQASRIRELLKQKLSELENRIIQAESRADVAENKVRLMEEHLSDNNWSSSGAAQHIANLQCVCQEKDKLISELESRIQEQRQERIIEAQQVETKAARIKEWVTNKLKELEEQNQALRQQNHQCNEQLDLLKSRLTELAGLSNPGVGTARGSTEDSSLTSAGSDKIDLDINQEDDISLSRAVNAGVKKGHDLGSYPFISSPSDDPFDSLSDRLGKSGRDSGSRDLDDGSLSLPFLSLPVQDPHSKTGRVRSKANSSSYDLNSVSDTRSDLEELQDLSLSTRLSSSTSTSSEGKQKYSNYPRQVVPRARAADEIHDYSEIYTPSKEMTSLPWGIHEYHSESEVLEETRPPTPPLHRFPSWEDRIYQVASLDGLTVSENLQDPGRVPKSASGHCPPGGFSEISVPVYTSVKGRASQIRSVPFTGDSSDSSENEEEVEGVVEGVDAGASPSKLSKAQQHRCSVSPSRLFYRETSLESGISDDYAIPPDAYPESQYNCSLPNLLKNSLPDTPKTPRKEHALEKTGYLTKLGGKLKTWKKRWFVLKNGMLSYWKSQHDINKKPQGQIILDANCTVTRADGANTFEIATKNKTYYLTAESITTMEDWIRILQNVQRKNAATLLLANNENKATIQGWLTKVKYGHAKRCWCVLLGNMFLYFKTPSDQTPWGQINMKETQVGEVEQASDSDEDNGDDGEKDAEFTIGIFPSYQGPTYLLLPTKHEKDSWLYHLTIVSGRGTESGTQCEQLIQKLMEVNGDPACILWKHPLILHSKEPISSPLTTLPSERLQAEAVKLFKSCLLFTSALLDSAGIDYHVVLAQNALYQCLERPELQPEFICALIKQTSRHSHGKHSAQASRTLSKFKHSRSLFLCDSLGAHKASPTIGQPTLPTITSTVTSSQATGTSNGIIRSTPEGAGDSKVNPPNYVFIQGWQLLSLVVSLFVPKNKKMLWYLRCHLNRHYDTKSEGGKYAAYCQRALERTIKNGGREAKPSRMEVLSILLKNPYHHSLPHAIPVHFANGTYQVVGFDGSTTVEEFLGTLSHEIGTRDSHISGFCLYSDDPIHKETEHYLLPHAKVCDVISRWETALREKGLGKFENTKVIKLFYKNRFYWKSLAKSEADKEKLLFCYQINNQICDGKFPLSRELALELTALMSQIDMGDYNPDKASAPALGQSEDKTKPHLHRAVERFYPNHYRKSLNEEELSGLTNSIMAKWITLKGKGVHDCVRIFLTCTRKWPFFGYHLYDTKGKPDNDALWLCVGEDEIVLLNQGSMQPLAKYPYSDVVTFGGCQEDFMLVVMTPRGTSKLLFSMDKPHILDLTLLIADYMNTRGRMPLGGFDSNLPATQPGTPFLGSLSRHESHRSVKSHHSVWGSPRGRGARGPEPDILKDSKRRVNHVEM